MLLRSSPCDDVHVTIHQRNDPAIKLGVGAQVSGAACFRRQREEFNMRVRGPVPSTWI